MACDNMISRRKISLNDKNECEFQDLGEINKSNSSSFIKIKPIDVLKDS
jgi:hypothetical protein